MKLGNLIKFALGGMEVTLITLTTAYAAQAASITLTGTIRDFQDSHPDFEYIISGLDEGIVENTIGSDGKPVYAGSAGNPSTTNKDNFDQWYRDVVGVNQSTTYSIELTDNDGDEIYTYSNSSFFPIDNQLFGNEGRPHNYHFTYELNSQFTYKGGEKFTFTGDDDLWVFINGKLAIDLGGVHGALSETVELDTVATTLGITPGNKYSLALFFAERHTSQSNFRIETSIVFKPPTTTPEPTSTLGFLAIATLGGGSYLKRKEQQKA
jgi:fibro-slime domain-containing protein